MNQNRIITAFGLALALTMTPAIHADEIEDRHDDIEAENSTSQFPETPAIRATERFVEDYSGDIMVSHVKRSYLFAAAFAEAEGKSFDTELVYVSMLLHDIGLEDPFDKAGDFETNGGEAAQAFLTQQGFAELGQKVARAINLHTNPATARHDNYEFALVARGALADVVGAGLDRLDPDVIGNILKSHPRHGTKSLLISMLERQALAKPNSRIGQTYKQVPVSDLIRNAPFAE